MTIESYDIVGSAHAPVIMLLHGGLVSRKMWPLQMLELSRSYRVCAPDLPGNGTQRHTRFTFEAATKTIQRTLVEIGAKRALLVGLSLGGYCALNFAARFPEAVSGLVLADCSDPLDQWYLPLEVAFADWLVRFGRFGYSPAAVARMLRGAYDPRIVEPLIEAGISWQGYRQAAHALAGYRPLADLRRVSAPILILNGEYDLSARAGERAFLAAAPHAKLKIIPWAKHASNLDRPAPFNAAVLGFARNISL